MHILIILAHPQPDSFNGTIAAMVRDTLHRGGHSVVFHDLYQEHFDPVLPAGESDLPENKLPDTIQQHISDLRQADGVVFVHPNWWGGPPAILRGWVERVIRSNSCYNFTAAGVVSHIPDKIVLVFSTANTPQDTEEQQYGDPVEVYWKTIVWGLLRPKSFARRPFASVMMSSPEERRHWLEEVRQITETVFIP